MDGQIQLELPLAEDAGLVLWRLVEAVEAAAGEMALTADHADELVCRALADLLEGGLAGELAA